MASFKPMEDYSSRTLNCTPKGVFNPAFFITVQLTTPHWCSELYTLSDDYFFAYNHGWLFTNRHCHFGETKTYWQNTKSSMMHWQMGFPKQKQYF